MQQLIEQYFDKETQSVHLKEENYPLAKRGMPGSVKLTRLSERKLTKDELSRLLSDLKAVSNLESERESSIIMQHKDYRIVATWPPISDGIELTIARPIKLLELKEYSLGEALTKRLERSAEGILVAGPPGQGKTTFARSLALDFSRQSKIVKTIESPRDMVLPPSITQYCLAKSSRGELHDLLLLSRPDFTIFDEMRTSRDFRLFSDLRLSGVGMVGVVHATTPVDAIQRFLGRVELGMIPSIIDTVLFIMEGNVKKVYSLTLSVKAPSGMSEKDMARPVVTVSDFMTSVPEYEIYSFADQTVVVKLGELSAAKAAKKDKQNHLEEEFPKKKAANGQMATSLSTDKPDLKPVKAPPATLVEFKAAIEERYVIFTPESQHIGKELQLFIDGRFLIGARVGKKNIIKIGTDSEIGKELLLGLSSGKQVFLKLPSKNI